MLKPFKCHPRENQNSFQHADEPLNWVRSVAEIDANVTKQRVKSVVMFTAQRHGEPRDVVLTADVVRLYPLRTAADYASANSL